MLKLGPYLIYPDTLQILMLILFDSVRIRIKGISRFENLSPEEMAKNILEANLKGNLVYAGQGHFKIMWLADFSVALKGILKIYELETVKLIIQNMLDISFKQGTVFGCYSKSGGSDLPYFRCDSFPWLLYCVNEYMQASNDFSFFELNKEKLQSLQVNFEETYIDSNGKIKKEITGDWVDTIKRPSSTWNNILALHTYK